MFVDIEARLASGQPVVVELGCGPHKRAGRIGVDVVALPGVDVVADIEEGLPFLPDASVDEIHAEHVLEHVENLERLLAEIVRVLKPHGKAFVSVPHFSNPYFYSDYTHRRFFGFYTFYYFVEADKQPRRKVPNHYSAVRIRILTQRIVFRSPLNERSLYCRVLNKLVNRSPRMQEFYEARLCYLFPCYELRVVFCRDA